MIDKWDIEVLEKWLKLAKTKGTDAIKIRLDNDLEGLKPGELAYRVIVKENNINLLEVH